MKAIHNCVIQNVLILSVVYANAKILKWKQFTTKTLNVRGCSALFMLMQRY